MAETTVDLATKVEELEDRLRWLEDRVIKLERIDQAVVQTVELPVVTYNTLHQQVPTPAVESRLETAPAVERIAAEPVESRIDIALVGKSLIGIGGAYLLRALTDSHLMPDLAGLFLGLAYAFFWIWLADRNASRQQTHAAGFYSAVAAVVGYPLICEATLRFHSFSIEFASFAMLMISGALLAMAWHRREASAAWIATLGSVAAAAVLALATSQISAPLLALSLAGAALWHMSPLRQWVAVRWPAVVAAWLMSIVLQLATAGRHDGDSAELATVVLLIVAYAWLGAVAAKNLLSREEITRADVVQAFGTIIFVLAGAARISAGIPHLMPAVTVAIGIVAAGAYFTMLRQPPEDVRAAYYFGGLAVACATIATAIPTTPVIAGIIWIVLAGASIVAARHFAASQFMAHAMIYAVAGATATGLLGGALQTISGLGTRPPIAIAPAVATAGIALAATLAVIWGDARSKTWRIAKVTLLALSALVCIAGFDLVALRVTGADAASGAAVRSAVIAIAAVALAMISRTRHFSDCSVLVYPVLILGAAKFAIDDFIAGRAATLFVTLAVYGFALLMLAKMKKVTPATT